MPKLDVNVLTLAVAEILDQRRIHAFDGHIRIDQVKNPGAINGRVLAAHDETEILKFSVAVAL